MKLLLIDDHALFREGLALLLQPLLPDLQVLEAGSCEEAQALLSTPKAILQGGQTRGSNLEENGSGIALCNANEAITPDLVLMDLALPGMSGVEGIQWLRQTYPEVPVVALSSSDDRETVLRTLDAGAMSFIPKSSNSAVLLAALRLVLGKGIHLPASVLTSSAPGGQANNYRLQAASASAVLTESVTPPVDLGLTPRQVEVLDLILQGKSTKLICRELDLSEGTVKTHTSAVLRSLKVTTRTQAVIAAARLGWRIRR